MIAGLIAGRGTIELNGKNVLASRHKGYRFCFQIIPYFAIWNFG
jgi:hypothetical protein